ncbi:hypothetical protein AAFF_G00260640 [Aldrovandia affinis]|uniref:Peptidase M12B domain-containing protein n=1 Tax=Aldrovandia affinis TaxID=143900 RepID=A0AAD7W245_9TELE|nr:hypothetical protein AAFF_G00260640 [Aldrovandia affinis]
MRHCFFSGHVNAKSEFPAVLSLCTGLVGTFTTQNGEYFLEPLMASDGDEHEEEHSKPHLLYRQDRTARSPPSNQTEPCTALGGLGRGLARYVFHSAEAGVHHSLAVLRWSDRAALQTGLLGLAGFRSRDTASDRSIAEELPSAPESTGLPHLRGNSTEGRSRARRKRFLSYPRFVELMVTADAKMARHHGHNLEHYILTIMSVVAAIYRDPSVGNLINIVIVKLVIIHNEQEGPSINFNAATTLHNFCVWQHSQNVQDDSDPTHHDTALLITREDICRAKDKCDTLGLAELGTMCDPHRSCSISEENGLSASFTIAHELGHVFNMPHDDNLKCKEAGMKQQYHVMAPTLNFDTSPWSWSKCSRKYITEFLDTGYGECLLDEPVGRPYDLPAQLPGQLYNANQQCQLMFGPRSHVCPYMSACILQEFLSPHSDQRGHWHSLLAHSVAR